MAGSSETVSTTGPIRSLVSVALALDLLGSSLRAVRGRDGLLYNGGTYRE